MTVDQIMNYVKPELIVVAIVLYFIGIWLKSVTEIKDKYIPFILGGIGILLCVLYVFATSTCSTGQDIAITQGILAAGLSTYVNQLIKQANKEE